jgi:hypothetical protein
MGEICGNLGAIDKAAGVETRLAIERLERSVVDLRSATATIVQQSTSIVQNITNNQTIIQGAPRYVGTFATATSFVIPASTHGFSVTSLNVQVFDTNGQWIIPDSIIVDNVTGTVTVTVFTAQAVKIVLT